MICVCGHPDNWHLAGSWTWWECYVAGCRCRMFRTPEERAPDA